MDGESGGLEFAAVGIGINFRGRDQFPAEIASKAAVLEEVTNLPLSRSKVCGAILDEFWDRYHAFSATGETKELLSLYRNHLCMLGPVSYTHLSEEGSIFLSSSAVVFSSNQKIIPWPMELMTQSAAPWRSRMFLTIERPKPVPMAARL